MKATHALLAGAIAITVVLPMAVAGASGSGATASAKKQIKALSKRVAVLEGQQSPTTLPPNGPAGGDLTGSFPNPEIGSNKVGSPEMLTVRSAGATRATTPSASSRSRPKRSAHSSSRLRSPFRAPAWRLPPAPRRSRR